MLARLTQLTSDTDEEFATLALAADLFDSIGRTAGTSDRSANSNIAASMPRREVVAAIALMQADLRHAWRIDDLSRRVMLSDSQLGRLFRAQTGVSPAAYLRRLRIDQMAELLATTDLQVREAAADVGWRNATVATRAFKKRYGISPREFTMHFHRRTT